MDKEYYNVLLSKEDMKQAIYDIANLADGLSDEVWTEGNSSAAAGAFGLIGLAAGLIGDVLSDNDVSFTTGDDEEPEMMLMKDLSEEKENV